MNVISSTALHYPHCFLFEWESQNVRAVWQNCTQWLFVTATIICINIKRKRNQNPKKGQVQVKVVVINKTGQNRYIDKSNPEFPIYDRQFIYIVTVVSLVRPGSWRSGFSCNPFVFCPNFFAHPKRKQSVLVNCLFCVINDGIRSFCHN